MFFFLPLFGKAFLSQLCNTGKRGFCALKAGMLVASGIQGKELELPLSISSHTGRWPLFILIREAFQEGPVVLGHLVWVCVGLGGMEKAHRSIQSQAQTLFY